MELVILGTGNAMVTRVYNTCFALAQGEDFFLVDAGGGNGIFVQARKANLDWTRLAGMFVTHAHTDHILGVIWVIRKIAELMKGGKRTAPLTLWCHDEAALLLRDFTTRLLPGGLSKYLDHGIELCVVEDGDAFSCLGMDFTAFDIGSTKAKQFGFAAVLPDGKHLTCLGDEPYNPREETYARGCDLLMSEAFCLHADAARFKPYEKHHSTALDAGKLAQELAVKRLLLYHTEDETLDTRTLRYTQEAKAAFSGDVIVPMDLERVTI